MDEQAYKDRFLHDFSAGFGLNHGGKDGYQDAGVPGWWYREFLALQRKERKEVVSVAQTGLQVAYETGSPGIELQYGHARIPLKRENIIEFIAILYPLARPEQRVPDGATVGYGGQSSSPRQYTIKEDRPVVLERMRQNNARMEYALQQMKKLADKAVTR